MLKDALEELGREYIKELALQLLKLDKKSSGELIRSLDSRVVETVNGLMLEIIAADYLKYVDKGRKPGGKMPPLYVLMKWVRQKPIPLKKGQTKQGVAFVIGKSISRKGIKPTNVINKTTQNILYNKKKLLEKGAVDEIEAQLNKIIQSL